MNAKKDYEAFRVRKFASPCPVLQALQPACQPAQQQQCDTLDEAPYDATAMETNKVTNKAIGQQQLLLVPDQERVIIHFDVDCFYCQVEEVRNPALRGRPAAVTQKYLVVTANYEARAAGVTKLMRITDACKACPQLTLVPGEDLTPYRAASSAIRAVLSRWGPCEKLGLDEAWVDVTQEVSSRIASGAGSSTPSLTDAPDQWPAHIVRSSMSLKADSKHRPQDLRVDATVAPSATAAAARKPDGIAQTPSNVNLGNVHGGEAAAVAQINCGDCRLIQPTQDTPASMPAAAAMLWDEAGECSRCGAGDSGGWQAKLYVGCMIAAEMREAVFREAGYRCSAGIAFNKLLSKLVSGLHKPNDQTAIPPTEAQACLTRLPARALRGVGFKAESVLKGWGVATAGDVAALSKQQLVDGLGEKLGLWLHGACRGKDPTPVLPSGPPKTISVEDSFKSCTSWTQISAVLQVLVPDLLERLAEDAQEHGPRTPSALTLKWRKAGTGWHRTSASAPWPNLSFSSAAKMHDPGVVDSNAASELYCSSSSQLVNPDHVELVATAALKLLKQQLTLAGSFNLTLLNIGVTGFKDGTASAGAGGIKRFFQQPAAIPEAPAISAPSMASTPDAHGSAVNAASACEPAVTIGCIQQQKRNTAAGRPVLLSKRQDRRLLEQLLQQQQQQQQGASRHGQQKKHCGEHEQQQLGTPDRAQTKRFKMQKMHMQQQQQETLQEGVSTKLHVAQSLQHSEQQQWQRQHMVSGQEQQQGTLDQDELQQQQEWGGWQQELEQHCRLQQQQQQQHQCQLTDKAGLGGSSGASMCAGGCLSTTPHASATGTSVFELHELAGWGCVFCEVVDSYEEDSHAC